VTLLGSGTCRIDPERGQPSACVVMGDTTYVIDIGFGTLERLARAGGLDTCRELHVHISHGHIDHVFGLFPLLQCLTYSDDASHLRVQRVVIHATESVCQKIKDTQRVWGESQTQLRSSYPDCEARSLEFRPGPNTGDWVYEVGSLTVHSVHLPAHENHGVSFALGGTSYSFTCDATELHPSLLSFCTNVDVCVFDLGHLSSVKRTDGKYTLSLDTAAQLLATANPRTAYASHIYLRHLQDRIISAKARLTETSRIVEALSIEARSRGFTGTVVAACDGMAI
jgi:ribonuclease BN (tRNA processing enzyme)